MLILSLLRRRWIQGTIYRIENIIGILADQLNRTDDNNQNDRQHHGIFGNVLSFVIPESFEHFVSPWFLI
jgi:hypothetical protein